MVQILYFAQLRERLGREKERLALAPGVRDVRGLIANLRQRGAPWADALADLGHVRVAVNCTMADEETPIVEGDEVALFPPVTGG